MGIVYYFKFENKTIHPCNCDCYKYIHSADVNQNYYYP